MNQLDAQGFTERDILISRCMLTVDEAVEITNDTEYGLAAYVSGGDLAKIREVASRPRAGQVNLNNAQSEG